jgi:hypothetical protein
MSQFFAQPGIFLAWGLLGGEDPKTLVDHVADAGFKWIAQEFGDPTTQPSAAEISALRAECHARGVYYGIWQNRPRDLSILTAQTPNFWILNVESDGYDYSALIQEFRNAHPLLPAAVITNGDPIINFKPFIAANIKAIPEAYQNQDPNTTPQNMVNLMKGFGYTYVFPALGVYDGYPLSSYSRAGDGYSVYLYEGMTDADLVTAHSWNVA